MEFTNRKKWLTFISFLCFGLAISLTGCSDDNDDPVIEPDPETPLVGLANILQGRKVIILKPDADSRMKISLSARHRVNVTFERGLLTPEVVAEGDSFAIKLSAMQQADQPVFFDRATIRYAEPITKAEANDSTSIYVVVQPAKATASSHPSYMHNIGKATDITGDLLGDNVKDAMLDFNLISTSKDFMINNNPTTVGGEYTGMRYEETVHQMHQEFGISGKVKGTGKAEGVMFSGSFTSNLTKERIASNKYEYTIEIVRKIMCDAHLKQAFTQEEQSGDFYLPYLTEDANQLLNDPNSNLYKSYPNTKEGILKLYSKYGTHIMTSGVYGGLYTYVYSRKMNAYFESSAVSAGATLSAKYTEPAAPGGQSSGAAWVALFITMMGQQGGEIKASGGNYDSEAHEAMDEKDFFITKGGTASSDYSIWDASITNASSNLAFIAYGPKAPKKTIPDDQENYAVESAGLIPLFYLAKDPERRAALKEHLLAYMDQQAIKMEKPRLILADFMMKNTEENNHKEKVGYKVMPDPNGDKRLYYPLMANSYAPADKGKMLDTSQREYIAVSDGTDQLWWYALAYEDECDGITAIQFFTDEERDRGYVKRGNRADHDMNWSQIDDHYVSIKMADKNTSPKDKITGVGIARSTVKSSKILNHYNVIASSGGTEMILPLDGNSSKDRFNQYWNWTDCWIDAGLTEGNSWFGNNSAANNSYWMFVAVTTKDLPVPLEISIPENF